MSTYLYLCADCLAKRPKGERPVGGLHTLRERACDGCKAPMASGHLVLLRETGPGGPTAKLEEVFAASNGEELCGAPVGDYFCNLPHGHTGIHRT